MPPEDKEPELARNSLNDIVASLEWAQIINSLAINLATQQKNPEALAQAQLIKIKDFHTAVNTAERDTLELGAAGSALQIGGNRDQLTKNEYIAHRLTPLARKMAAPKATTPEEWDTLSDKILNEMMDKPKKYRSDHEFRKLILTAEEDFARLEQKYPDAKPGNGVIDIEGVAAKNLEHLKQIFPEEMARMLKAVEADTGGRALTPSETIRAIEPRAWNARYDPQYGR